jgi:hypothetical protein
MKSFAIVFTSALLLTGCGQTSFGDTVRSTIAERGAKAYDTGLENAEWFICQAASIGSIRRRYGQNPISAGAYRILCEMPSQADLLMPPTMPSE